MKETWKKQEKEYSRRHVWKEQLYIIIGASSVVVAGRDDHSLGFAVRAMHSRSLSQFEPGLGKFEVAWEVGWNCCEVVTRMSPTNTDRWVRIGKILFFSSSHSTLE